MPKTRKCSGKLSCSRVLHIMVILAYFTSYMLIANMTIAIVEMTDFRDVNLSTFPSKNITEEETTIGTEKINVNKPIDRYNWSTAQKQNMLGAFFWGSLPGTVVGGRLADVYGTRKIFGSFSLLAGIFTILLPQACDISYYLGFLVRVLVTGLAGSNASVLLPLAVKWIPSEDRTKYVANISANHLGAFFLLWCSGYIMRALGWRSLFYLTGAISIFFVIPWFGLVYDSPEQNPRISEKEKYKLKAKMSNEDDTNVSKSMPWKILFTSKAVWAIIITLFFSGFVHFTLVMQTSIYFKDVLNFDIEANGVLSSLPYIGDVFVAYLTGYLSDRSIKAGKFSRTAIRKTLYLIGGIVCAVLEAMLIYWGDIRIIAVLIFFGTSVIKSMMTSTIIAVAYDVAPNYAGTIIGVAISASNISGWISVQLVAFLTKDISTLDTWQYLFMVTTAAYLFCGVFFAVFGVAERQPWNQPQKKAKEEVTVLLEGNKIVLV